MAETLSCSNLRQTALALLCSGSQKARPPPSSSSRNEKLSLNRNGKLSLDEKPSFKWTPNLDGTPHWNGLGGMKENLQLLGYSVRFTTIVGDNTNNI